MSIFKKRYPSKAAKRRASRPAPEGAGLVTASPRSFQEALAGKAPVVVMFGAVWCGPCQTIKPSVDAEARKRPEVTALYLSVDDPGVDKIAMEYHVMGVPTVMVFKNGLPVSSALASRNTVGAAFDLAEGGS